MEEGIQLKCPACGHPLGFVCKDCDSEVELTPGLTLPMECDICGGELEFTAFMSDKDIEEANKDAE